MTKLKDTTASPGKSLTEVGSHITEVGEPIRFVGAIHPLKTELTDVELPEGMTILEMLIAVNVDPIISRDAVIFIDDWEVPREAWPVIRPRAGHQVSARILAVPRGGGGGGKKNPLRTILTIAIMVAAPYLGPVLGASMGLSTAALGTGVLANVSMASLVGGAIISVAGNMLMNAIAPVKSPQMPTLSGSGAGASIKESPSLFLSGSRNSARPFDVVPSVLGYFRFKPAKGAVTYSEILGDSNVLRDLFVIGHGELELSDWRIGDTPITDYSDYELEVRTGTVSDADLTVYTDQVAQAEFSIKLVQVDDWHQRTSDLDADELSIDIAFPQGLVKFGGGGTRGRKSVTIEVEWRIVGGGGWSALPGTVDTTFDIDWISGSAIEFTHSRSVAIRHGIRWKTGTRGQYEVRVRRTTADNTSTSVYDDAFWGVLRTFTNDDPLAFSTFMAKAALQIRATDQLNGVVDELSVLAKSVCPDWDTGTSSWITRVTNNPASLFRHVLQGPGKAVAVADEFIDITGLQDFHDFCVTNGFAFNQVRDFSASIYETLSDICAAGRASVTMVDGKWSVVMDEAQSIYVTHITPRNSFGFEAEKAFFDVPHAWRIRFPNENTDYKQDERIVYRDGYNASGTDGNAAATLFEMLEFPGVTDPDQIWKLGRFQGAQVVQRPERWSVSQDFESIIVKRGSLIKVTHDVLLVGLASGRIVSMETDGGGNVTSITVDETLEMASGTYGLVIRRDVAGDTTLSVQIDLEVGGVVTVVPTTPIPAASAPEVDDMFGFGTFGQETEDALVLFVDPQDDLVGRITMVPYRSVVYDADSGTIPPYVPTISDTAGVPMMTILEVITDESVLARGGGDDVIVRAEIRVDPVIDAVVHMEVQQRATSTSEPWYDSSFEPRTQNTGFINDVQQLETYDFRARWNDLDRLPGAWTEIANVSIIGKSTPPAALVGVTISVFGGQAHFRWDNPDELDVRFGGQVHFRHSPSFADPEWSESTSIGEVAQARSLFAVIPLKPGTYLARTFDADGNPSTTVVSVSTKQASILEFANVTSIDEAPAYSGTHDNTVNKGGILEMQGIGLFDDIPDLDLLVDLDYYGGVVSNGTYTFGSGIDLTTVKRVRLTSRIDAFTENVLIMMDSRTADIDDWEDFDGTLQAQADCQVWVRHTDDDPAGSPTWTTWERLDSAEFEARGFEFKAELTSNDPAFDIHVTELGVDVDEVV